MGGMHTWIWGENYPLHGRAGADGLAADRDGGAQLDAAADDARHHPQRSRLQGGNYTPAADDEIRHRGLRHRLRRRHARLSGAGADGGRPTRWSTSGSRPVTADANDFIYQWEASHDYNPSQAGADRGDVLAINAPTTSAIRRRPASPSRDEAHQEWQLYLIPATETRGHLTTGNAKFYSQIAGIAADRAAADDVKPLAISHRINFASAHSNAYYLSVHPLARLGLNRIRLLKNSWPRRNVVRHDDADATLWRIACEGFARIALLACLPVLAGAAFAFDNGQYENVPRRHPRLVQERDGAERRALLRHLRRPSHRI